MSRIISINIKKRVKIKNNFKIGGWGERANAF